LIVKLLTAAALLCLASPAIAEPVSFRADRQAWVRQNFLPHCYEPNWFETINCNCMVPVVAERITEAEAARFASNPAAKPDIGARINMQSITFFCIKAQKPPPL
jgi:hypothetical protein